MSAKRPAIPFDDLSVSRYSKRSGGARLDLVNA
jgi:hypothetical protein